jgi:hypothetical protein
MDAFTKARIDRLTAPERRALTGADPDTGLVIAQHAVRDKMVRQGLIEGSRSLHYLTDHGRAMRQLLLDNQHEFQVDGVPWPKIEEITDLYLGACLSISEISRRTRVTGDSVEAVLRYRGVLVSAA